MYTEHPFRLSAAKQWVEHTKQVHNQRILVAGCGAGRRVFELCSKGADVTAVDQSETAIDFLRESFDQLPMDEPELINEELQSVDLPDNEFDYIYCIGVIHHIVDPLPVLERFSEALKPSGTLDIWVYNSRSPKHYEKEAMRKLTNVVPVGAFLSSEIKRLLNWWDKYENPVVNAYTEKEISCLLERKGFKIQSVEYENSVFDHVGLYAILPAGVNFLLERKFPKRRIGIRLFAELQ